jgi:hypothetical protein
MAFVHASMEYAAWAIRPLFPGDVFVRGVVAALRVLCDLIIDLVPIITREN